MDEKKCCQSKCSCKGSAIQADGCCSKACKECKTEGGKCACGHPGCR